MTNREIDVSDPTKRIVRQRCGFGCVICGLPIYQYDHMYGYTVETADDPTVITLLCARHHERYSKPHVIEKKKSPLAASNASR